MKVIGFLRVACLPLTVADSAIVCRGMYPAREALASYAGIETPPGVFTDAVKQFLLSVFSCAELHMRPIDIILRIFFANLCVG
jgi:hypothetical protein